MNTEAPVRPAEAADVPDFTHWPLALARQWRAVALRSAGGSWRLASDRSDPDAMLLQLVQQRLRRNLRWHPCSSQQLDRWLDDASQGPPGEAGLSTNCAEHGYELAQEPVSQSADAGPVVALLDELLRAALNSDASDLHIEREPGGAEVRLRLDGVMLPLRRVDGTDLAERLISRLKVLAELDIGERRLPQDGRFRVRVAGRGVDLRLSIMPTSHGEDAVLRVLDRLRNATAGAAMTLEGLGFDAVTRGRLRALARQPYGLLLVTGPTGSGKTTTLYALIGEISTGSEKIVTIEDPVEMELRGVTQIPVNERKGLDFARGLRSILRHDPDRVMVGEIRDPETAQIAVQAALTGHLVFSTVHANNALDVIGRLIHMGLDPYHVVSSLSAVLAQRLMRMLCTDCSQPWHPEPGAWARYGLTEAPAGLRRAVGCPHCRGTGYKGRRAVAELLVLDDSLRELIAERAPAQRIKASARERGMVSLHEQARAWVLEGLTTFEELERVTLAE